MLARQSLCGLMKSLDMGEEVPLLRVLLLAGWCVRTVVQGPGVSVDNLMGQEVRLPGERLAAYITLWLLFVGSGHVTSQISKLGILFVTFFATGKKIRASVN